MSKANPSFAPKEDFKLEEYFEGFAAGLLPYNSPTDALASGEACLAEKPNIQTVSANAFNLLDVTL